MTDQLIRDYYACFNERRIADVAVLFADDAMLDMPPFVQKADGRDGYAHFAEAWLRAFPDAQFTIKHVEQRNETMCEVDLIATGTHSGLLDLGTYGLLQPSGVRLTLRLRELLEIRDGKITSASLALDLNHLVRELNQVDDRKDNRDKTSRTSPEPSVASISGLPDCPSEYVFSRPLGEETDESTRVEPPHCPKCDSHRTRSEGGSIVGEPPLVYYRCAGCGHFFARVRRQE